MEVVLYVIRDQLVTRKDLIMEYLLTFHDVVELLTLAFVILTYLDNRYSKYPNYDHCIFFIFACAFQHFAYGGYKLISCMLILSFCRFLYINLQKKYIL